MKDQFCRNHGFATIEIIIAFAILALALAGVATLVFDNQSASGGGLADLQAFQRAANLSAGDQVSAASDFLSIISSSPASDSADPFYMLSATVTAVSPCSKAISRRVMWDYASRPQTVSFVSLVTDPVEASALGGECEAVLSEKDAWRKPETVGSNISMPSGRGTALDSREGMMYAAFTAGGLGEDDVVVMDASDPENIVKKSSFNVSSGIEDIDVLGLYAFMANDERSGSGQLQIANITNPAGPFLVASVSLPGITGNCPNTCPGGRSIFVYDGKAYIGLHRLAAGGAAEFHILDVSNPSAPVWLGSKGGTALGDAVDNNINDIVVRDQIIGGIKRRYAYLATSGDAKEIIILNVTNPSVIPDPVGTASTGSIVNLGSTAAGDLDATRLYVIGNRAFVGRKRATGSQQDFFVLDVTNAGAVSVLGSMKLGLGANGSEDVEVRGIRVSGDIALVATSDPRASLQIWDVSDPAEMMRREDAGCSVPAAAAVAGFDAEEGRAYLSFAGGQGPSVIAPFGNSVPVCTVL